MRNDLSTSQVNLDRTAIILLLKNKLKSAKHIGDSSEFHQAHIQSLETDIEKLQEEEFEDAVQKIGEILWKFVYEKTPTTSQYPLYQNWYPTDPIGKEEYLDEIARMLRKFISR